MLKRKFVILFNLISLGHWKMSVCILNLGAETGHILDMSAIKENIKVIYILLESFEMSGFCTEDASTTD